MDLKKKRMVLKYFLLSLLLYIAVFSIIASGGGGGDGGGGGSTGPFDATGHWEGTWQSNQLSSINGTFDVDLEQSGSDLSGKITISYIGLNDADVTGTVNGSQISFGDIDGIITFTGTMTSDTRASGTYNAPSLGDNGIWTGEKVQTDDEHDETPGPVDEPLEPAEQVQ